MRLSRRGLLVAGAAALVPWRAAHAFSLYDDTIFNPCLATPLPTALANHAIVTEAFAGIAPEQVCDVHVHLVGTGDSGRGPWLPAENGLLHPIEFVRRQVLMNAACVNRAAVDESFVTRLHALAEGFPRGVKLMLLAFDYHHDRLGQRVPSQSAFHVPDAYAAAAARRFPQRFEWAASIHPYRADAVGALTTARGAGARAVKWLPNSMGIDPASPRCDAFYEAMARTGTPLLTHAGEEATVNAREQQELGNPLRLRRALEHGVRVIVAHCATLGTGRDLDRGPNGPQVANFALFTRLMDDARYERSLFGDISAIVQRNRAREAFPALLTRQDWHARLLWGSDYPLPGVLPLISVKTLAEQGWLDRSEIPILSEVRRHNPVLFDFLLKRRLSVDGKRFAAQVFETRRVFTGPAGS